MNQYSSLKTIFHEPNRLAIVSALCAAPDGMSFPELKEELSLTDGNLSRHLKALEGESVISIVKSFVGVTPRTQVTITESGRDRFLDYLSALEGALKSAAASVSDGAFGALGAEA
jgi:DNA-binding MarR family transcriptional regulator